MEASTSSTGGSPSSWGFQGAERRSLRTRTLRVLVLGASLLLLGARPAERTSWIVDRDHSYLGFSVSHLGVSRVTGRFKRFEGRLELHDTVPERSRVVIIAEADSIDTGVAKRDAHLRSPEFFDTKRFPRLSFASEKVIPRGLRTFEVHGRLSLHGVSQPVVLTVTLTDPVTHPVTGGLVRGASCTTTIDRQDYGLTWNRTLESGGLLLGREVELDLRFELVRRPEAL